MYKISTLFILLVGLSCSIQAKNITLNLQHFVGESSMLINSEYQNIEGLVIEGLPKGNAANNYGNYQGSMSNHDKVYENVVDVLQNGAAISTNAFEGMKTVEIIDKIYAKIRHGILI